MPDLFKSIKITQPTPGGPLVEQVVGAVQVSAGAADANKIVLLNPMGQLDPSMGGGGGGSSVSINSTPVASPNFVNNSSIHFNVVGSNVTAVVVGGTAATDLATTGASVNISSSAPPTHAGQLLISQPGNITAIWADPLMQGLYADGSSITSPPAFAIPTTIQPVYVGGSKPGNILQGFSLTNAGSLNVNVNENSFGLLTTNLTEVGGSSISLGQHQQAASIPVTMASDQTPIPILAGTVSEVLTAWSSGTAINATQVFSPLTLPAFGTGPAAIIQFDQTSTITAGAVTFEATYDGINWVAIVTNQILSPSTLLPLVNPYSFQASTNKAFLVLLGGAQSARIRLSTTITGTGTVTPYVTLFNYAPVQYVAGILTPNTVPPDSNNQGVLPAVANAVAPTYIEGNQVRVNATITGGGSVQYANGSVVATPTGTVAMGKDASNNLFALKLDGSQNLDVNTQSAVFSAVNGATLPANAAWIGASDGTNLQGLQVESSTNKNLKVAIYQAGNEVTVTGANALKVDGSGATQPVSVAGTVLVSNTTQNYAQGSTTSGQIGPLGQGAVTTNDPTYTTGQTDPLSLTTAGHLRTQDFATSGTGVAVPTKAMFVGGIGADGFLHGLSTDNSGILNVNASFSGTVTPGFVTDRTQSGAITSTQNVAVSTYGAASVIFNITGTWTGTIAFQTQLADNSWITATAYPVYVGGPGVTSTSVNGQWQLPVAGFQAFRVIGNNVNSGTATANLEAGAGAFSIFVQQLSAADLNATVVQGNAGTAAQAWFIKVTDGTNVFGTTTAHPFLTQDLSDGAPNTTSQPAEAMQVAGWDGTHLRVLSTDASGFLNVNAAISGSFTPALTSDRTSTGTITNTQNVTLNTQGTGTTLFNITGSWTGTIVFEVSVDGTNWVSARALPRYTTATPPVTQTTANGQWSIATGGVNSVRLRGNTVTSGTATIWLEGGAGAQDMNVLAIIYDPNNNTTPVVKGSTTVPVAADNALVVSLSPNSSQFATSTTANALPGTNPVSVGTSSTAVVNTNASRKEVTIINTGTTVIFLGLGQTPTTTAYHIALAKCTAANDGTGGTWTSDMFKGTINAIGSAGGGTVVWTELT